jgi:L-lactate dehydrogenase complex protein LldG
VAARENILGRIRAAQGKPLEASAEEREHVRSHLAAHPQSPRPRVGDDLASQFRNRALALSSTVEEIGALSEAPRAVANYLGRNGLPLSAVCWPELAVPAWEAAGIKVEARSARDGDLVGVTGAFCAIAETGTLMLLTGPRTPAAVSLLPETHIALLSAERIVRGMEEAWRLLRADRSPMPRAVNFVSGPSRTADIEQTVTMGAHGPYRVHVVIYGR